MVFFAAVVIGIYLIIIAYGVKQLLHQSKKLKNSSGVSTIPSSHPFAEYASYTVSSKDVYIDGKYVGNYQCGYNRYYINSIFNPVIFKIESEVLNHFKTYFKK